MAPQSILCWLHFQLLMNRAVLQQIHFKWTVFPRKNSSPFWEKVVLNKIMPLPRLHLTKNAICYVNEWRFWKQQAFRAHDVTSFCYPWHLSMSRGDFPLCFMQHLQSPPPILQRELKMNNVAVTTRLQWENVSSFVFMGASNSSVSMTCCL